MTTSTRLHDTFTIVPRGPFSLPELGTFGFGPHQPSSWDGVMRLALCLDGYRDQVGVEVRQDRDGAVTCVARAQAGHSLDLDTVRAQVARVLSLDHDGEGYVAIGQRDPIVRRLLAVAPGLRPPLFYSPYEAAAWGVLSARRPAQQMAAVRRQLNEAHGVTFELAGERHAAFPTPEQLLAVTEAPGLSADKIDRLHGVARAAARGQLDASRLLGIGPTAATAEVQSVNGIGPFYAALIVVRGTGFTDVLATNEPKLLALAGELYGLGRPASADELAEIAEQWRPFRTWVSVLMRAAGPRLTSGA